MPYVIDKGDGGIYERPRRPWIEWGPAEQARNLREALGADLDDHLETLVLERTDAGDIDDYYFPKLEDVSRKDAKDAEKTNIRAK